MSENVEVFLEQVPVFTLHELIERLRQASSPEGMDSHKNVKSVAYNLIKNRRRTGKIGVIKEGVYYVVRPGTIPDTAPVDQYLVTSKLSPDAVLAFHTALDVLGFGHSVFNTFYYVSKTYHRPVRFRGGQYRSVKAPPKLLKAGKELFGTTKIERLGVKIFTTDKERTLVEGLEHPEYCGGFEELYRSLEKIPYIQSEVVLDYLDIREQKNLYARVGFFLEQHREDLHVEEVFLHQLERNKPAQPVYWVPRRKGGVLVKRWNLIVPEAVKDRRWEEF